MTEKRLLESMKKRGYLGRVASIRRLHDLREEIETKHGDNLFDEEFYRDRLIGFVLNSAENFPGARSLIVIAVRQSQKRFIFTWEDRRISVIVPPTYLHWQKTDRQVEATLTDIIGVEGYRVVQTILPKKLLASRSGLAAYGRNNIVYIAGMGSFFRLVAFCSDLPCNTDTWQEPRLMTHCSTCKACLQNCPSGAIPSERFLLRGERCIVFHNEQSGDIPFPDWLEPSWHNCLVGCMHCQTICPENLSFNERFEDVEEFSVEDTALLLEGIPLDQLPSPLVRKLRTSDLAGMIDTFPRNLKVLLHQAVCS